MWYEDIELPDGQQIKQIEESGCKYLGIIQDSELKTQVMKDKIRTEYLKVSEIGIVYKNVFMGINQWELGVVRYSAGIVDLSWGDLELLDRKTRKYLHVMVWLIHVLILLGCTWKFAKEEED